MKSTPLHTRVFDLAATIQKIHLVPTTHIRTYKGLLQEIGNIPGKAPLSYMRIYRADGPLIEPAEWQNVFEPGECYGITSEERTRLVCFHVAPFGRFIDG